MADGEIGHPFQCVDLIRFFRHIDSVAHIGGTNGTKNPTNSEKSTRHFLLAICRTRRKTAQDFDENARPYRSQKNGTLDESELRRTEIDLAQKLDGHKKATPVGGKYNPSGCPDWAHSVSNRRAP